MVRGFVWFPLCFKNDMENKKNKVNLDIPDEFYRLRDLERWRVPILFDSQKINTVYPLLGQESISGGEDTRVRMVFWFKNFVARLFKKFNG